MQHRIYNIFVDNYYWPVTCYLQPYRKIDEEKEEIAKKTAY